MPIRRIAASAVAIALAATAFAGGSPAFAAQNVFLNPATTPQTTDLDISDVAIDYTADEFRFAATTQNFSPATGYSLSVYLTPSQQPLSAQPYYFTFTTVVTPTSSVVYEYLTQGDSTAGPVTVANAYSSVDATSKVVTLSLPPTGIFTNTTLFAWASLSDDATAVTAGIPAAGGTLGFGPINVASIATVVGLRVSSSSQVYGSTPAVAFVSVGPGTARGRVTVMDGTIEVGAEDYLGSDIALNLPQTLALGTHTLTAVFTPDSPALFTAATSSRVRFDILSPGTKTSTAISLSAVTQHYKKKAAKVSVRVSHKPAGKVTVYDGAKKLTTLTLKNGKASFTVSSKLAKGKHALRAVFIPKHPLSYAPSASKARTLKVVR